MKRLLIVVCAASTLLGSGAAVALASSSTSGGVIHVYGVNPSANGNKTTIIITGAFAAKGTTRNVSTNIGQVITPKGTFKVNLTKLNNAPGSGGLNPKTCSGAFTATAPVTLFGGTGAYKGISGTLILKETFAGISPKLANGKCNMNATTAGLSFFQGSGTVKF
ncbi:MAG: hypothetical protein JO372_22350 [Solirubrobacterales bacterium]|nr:hypothetical protein [Solirubrobacterales bacterium]